MSQAAQKMRTERAPVGKAARSAKEKQPKKEKKEKKAIKEKQIEEDVDAGTLETARELYQNRYNAPKAYLNWFCEYKHECNRTALDCMPLNFSGVMRKMKREEWELPTILSQTRNEWGRETTVYTFMGETDEVCEC